MSENTVRKFLEDNGYASRLTDLGVACPSVGQAAEAIGCTVGQIAKTLALATRRGVILVVTAGDVRLDNQKFKYRFSCKAALLGAAEIQATLGCEPDAVSPFCVPAGVRVYLDESLFAHAEVYPAAGSAKLSARLTPGELAGLLSGCETVDVTHGSEMNHAG